MFKNILITMSRYQNVIDKALKIKNFDPLINHLFYQEFKILGLDFPSSRMNKDSIKSYKKYNYSKISDNINDKQLSEIEKIIGLDIPNSRFNL